MSRLGSLKLNLLLPEIASPETQSFYETLAVKLERFAQQVGTNSDSFRRRKVELHEAASAGKDVRQVISKLAYVRPLLHLWRDDDDFLSKVPPSREVLNYLVKLLKSTRRNRLGRLAIREAFDVYFQRYDKLAAGMEDYCTFLRLQIGEYAMSELMFGLDKLKHRAEELISSKGHIWLAVHTARTSSTLPDEAERHGIPRHSSRLYEVAQHEYYIERVRSLQPSQEHVVLTEVQNQKVYAAPYGDGRALGHTILELLIDKLASVDADPADSWLKTILSIAGDPRVSSTSINYMKWWRFLGEPRVRHMRRWLSRMDMELFLEIVKEFSDRKGGEDMKRMFPKRKRFLQGLFESGLVSNAQLFLSSEPENFLQSSVKNKKELPYYRKLSGTNSKLTVFHFRIGDVHVIEGTHSFMLAILDRIPKATQIGTYQASTISYRDVGPDLEDIYKAEFGYSGTCERIRHLGNWPGKAYMLLSRLGVNVSADKVMDREDYLRMIR